MNVDDKLFGSEKCGDDGARPLGELRCLSKLLISTERRDGDNFDTPNDHRDFLSEFVGVTAGDMVVYSGISGVIFKLFGRLF